MGCVECKLCKQEEEKSQFEYPNDANKKIPNPLENSNNNKDDSFLKEFEERIKFIGQFIQEEEFDNMLPEQANIIAKKEAFPVKSKNINSHKIRPVEFENGNVYYGQWNENFEMEGYGKYFLKEEKVLAEGIWEKGELKNARIFYPNGDFYEGEMANSAYNGKGKLILENKDEYIGEFVDGEKNGEGKMIFNDDKTEYTGNFVKNNFNGNGNMKWNNGIEYKGNFKENTLDGEGVLFNNEEKYEGNFEKNSFHGKGKYTYLNGDQYEGSFEYGIRKGKGIYRKKNGFIFEGLWDNNVPNGYGKIMINNNENVLKCNFHNGKIIEDQIYDIESFPNNIDFSFYHEEMNLQKYKLTHLENEEVLSSQYRAGTMLSFLED